MKLYIETENGEIKNHPALEDNLLQAFGAIPAHWVLFERVENPIINIYEVYKGVTYEWVNGIVTDVHHVRAMTDAEKTKTQQTIKDSWAIRPNAINFTAWVFDETTCTFVPPVVRPVGNYCWRGSDNSWVEVPPKPDGDYAFDLETGTWVALPIIT